MVGSEDFDFELIAAFIDGRLGRGERLRVVKMLAESEAAFEVYADALRTRADLAKAGVIPIEVARERRSHPWFVAAPAAAAAVLLIAVMPRIQAQRERASLEAPVSTIARPLLAVHTNLPKQSGEHHWRATRGGGPVLVESTTVFRLGVHAADLRLALSIGERDRAGRVTGDMIDLLQPVRFSDGVRADYVDVRSRIDSGYPMPGIIVVSDSAELRLGEFLGSRWFDVGKWFGAGEVAARAHAADFFASSHTARFLSWASKPGHLAPNDLELLQRVAAPSGKSLSDGDFEAIEQTFAILIRRLGE